MSLRKWQFPESIRETFSDYFKQFEHTQIVVVNPVNFYGSIGFDKLVEKDGVERVERDYTALCLTDWAMRAKLTADLEVQS